MGVKYLAKSIWSVLLTRIALWMIAPFEFMMESCKFIFSIFATFCGSHFNQSILVLQPSLSDHRKSAVLNEVAPACGFLTPCYKKNV